MRRRQFHSLAAILLLAQALGAQAHANEVLTIGIGTQDTTTNTVTSGAVIRELKLLQKYLPTTGKYAQITYKLDWQNFTSGPPVTNGMMADKLQFGSMGDYPLVVNGATFQNNPDAKSQLIAVSAYNIYGSGNGIVVHKDSPYFQLSDLKGKVLSVPFGSAAHGMVLKAMQDRGWDSDYFQLVSQSPEVGSTNLQEKKIDAHADFVPFAELLPFRGFARKIFDGVETNAPTWHGVVVRSDFAAKYPEVVVAFIKANIAANAWVRENPQRAAEKIAEWTGIDKEVVYIFLGPGGIMTMDPTIKPILVEDAASDAHVLQTMGRMKAFDVAKWVNDSYVRQAYKELGLDYDSQLRSLANYEIHGEDKFCHQPIAEPRKAGEIWAAGEPITAYSSTACTLAAHAALTKAGHQVRITYLFDTARGIKLFGEQAFFTVSGDAAKPEIAPFLLKKDAEALAAKSGGRVVGFAEAEKLAAAAEGMGQ